MECRDVREMADSFLGEELLTETNHEILRHLETCPVCRADLAARRALRAAVQRAFHHTRDLDPSPEFMAHLRTTLRDASHTVTAPRGIRFQGWWALAATVLLAIALGVAYRGRDWITATGALARAAVGDHRNCALQFRLAEKPISLEEAAFGCEKEIEVSKLDACGRCNGTGAEAGSRASHCPTCGGRGQVVVAG